jgi:hypothetical protein
MNALNKDGASGGNWRLSEAFKSVAKITIIVLSATVLFFAFLGLFKIGALYWFYTKVFGFASGMLGLDYYTSLFITVFLVSGVAIATPVFIGSVMFGRKALIIPAIVVIVIGLACASVHTVGRDVNFNQITGEQNLYMARTPDGKVYCRGINCKFDTKYGIRYVPVTTEMLINEAKEERARADAAHLAEENARKKTMRQVKKEEELARQEQRKREERESKERLEQFKLEQEREARQRVELEVEAIKQRLLAGQQERGSLKEGGQ